MDLKALQTRLRQFAAEREWQPFHTPKNLVMALTVEAAELAEIFQWMTPEQSQIAHGDVVLQQQIADEVADVLLYLVQIADHTGVDLERAIGHKLVKNAKKHPPLRPGLPAGTAAAAPIETHVLVDWENVQPRDSDIRSLVCSAFRSNGGLAFAVCWRRRHFARAWRHPGGSGGVGYDGAPPPTGSEDGLRRNPVRRW